MKCPICGSERLALYDTLWPLSKIKPKQFKCDTCGWNKRKEEVLEAGGLDAFRADRGSAFKQHKHSSNNFAFKQPKKQRKHQTSSYHNLFSLKILIIYWITFTIGFWISTMIIPFIKTTNLFVIFLLTGLCLELSARVCQMFLYKKLRITLDKGFILWVFIHSIVIYSVLFLINKITISNQYLFFIVVGLGVAIVTHIIWRFMYRK